VREVEAGVSAEVYLSLRDGGIIIAILPCLPLLLEATLMDACLLNLME